MTYWKITNRQELEALAAKASSKEDLVESLCGCAAGLREWTPFVVLHDNGNEGEAVPVDASADWALNQAIDGILRHLSLPENIAANFTRGLKRTLQKGLAGFARNFGDYKMSIIFENDNLPHSRRVRPGLEAEGELSASEAEMVTRLLGKLHEAMTKHGSTDADVFNAFLSDDILYYIPGNTTEYNSYRDELSASKRMHAEIQVLRMLLKTHSQPQAAAR